MKIFYLYFFVESIHILQQMMLILWDLFFYIFWTLTLTISLEYDLRLLSMIGVMGLIYIELFYVDLGYVEGFTTEGLFKEICKLVGEDKPVV